ncbi:MAG: hypothetical protein DBY35_06495 [Bacteroidales bacterium]|nr:MAG: hypothetical protein DBY35_06495 [Bacteroidales bacterium]
MITKQLTDQIKQWLDTPPESRDLAAGARLLLQATRNRILYANITRNLKARAAALEYNLSKVHKQRLAKVTREQVSGMMVQVDRIAAAHGLANPAPANRSDFQKGKRADHDSLPPEIQQLWVDNGSIRLKMRDAHTRIRLISPRTSTCPDSDRFPLAKILIDLDKRYRENWNRYDHYVRGTPVEDTPLAVDPRTASRNAARLCNLLLGKYAVAPDASLKERITGAYAKVINPTPALTGKMKSAKLI